MVFFTSKMPMKSFITKSHIRLMVRSNPVNKKPARWDIRFCLCTFGAFNCFYRRSERTFLICTPIILIPLHRTAFPYSMSAFRTNPMIKGRIPKYISYFLPTFADFLLHIIPKIKPNMLTTLFTWQLIVCFLVCVAILTQEVDQFFPVDQLDTALQRIFYCSMSKPACGDKIAFRYTITGHGTR